jgi:hypothetical protein
MPRPEPTLCSPRQATHDTHSIPARGQAARRDTSRNFTPREPRNPRRPTGPQRLSTPQSGAAARACGERMTPGGEGGSSAWRRPLPPDTNVPPAPHRDATTNGRTRRRRSRRSRIPADQARGALFKVPGHPAPQHPCASEGPPTSTTAAPLRSPTSPDLHHRSPLAIPEVGRPPPPQHPCVPRRPSTSTTAAPLRSPMSPDLPRRNPLAPSPLRSPRSPHPRSPPRCPPPTALDRPHPRPKEIDRIPVTLAHLGKQKG